MHNHKKGLFTVGKDIFSIFLLPSIIRSILELSADRLTVTVSNQAISLLTFGVRNNETIQN